MEARYAAKAKATSLRPQVALRRVHAAASSALSRRNLSAQNPRTQDFPKMPPASAAAEVRSAPPCPSEVPKVQPVFPEVLLASPPVPLASVALRE